MLHIINCGVFHCGMECHALWLLVYTFWLLVYTFAEAGLQVALAK
jgi:hypothetical protein